MKILIFGKTGQVAWELQRALAPLGNVIALDQTDANFTDPESLIKPIQDFKPNVIVNAAAYTAVDKAESDQAIAFQINSEAVKVIALESKKINSLLIHYSTDYVYEGNGLEARDENAVTKPLGVYGASKLSGDSAIIETGGRYIILRTSWVYAARGNNFIKTMIRLASECESLNIIDDQVGSPTGAELVADVSAHIIKQSVNKNIQEIYHLVANGYASWFEFTNYIVTCLKAHNYQLAVNSIQPIETKDYPTPAQRPLNSRLLVNKIERDFNLTMPDWKIGVKRVVDELVDKR